MFGGVEFLMRTTWTMRAGFVLACGSLLLAARLATAAPFAYVPIGSTNSVSVIDTNTDTIVADVPVGVTPMGVAISPDGSPVYIGNYNSASVSVIDAASNTVVATIPVQGGPFVLSAPRGTSKLYVGVVHRYGGSVQVIDTRTYAVAADIPVSGQTPWEMMASADATRLYVSAGSGIYVIDTATDTLVTGLSPATISIVPIGFLTGSRSGSIFVTMGSNFGGAFSVTLGELDVATSTWSRFVSVPGFWWPAVGNPSGTRAYLSGPDTGLGPVSIVDIPAGRVMATVAADATGGLGYVSNAARGDRCSTSKVYAISQTQNRVTVIDGETGGVWTTIALGSGARAVGNFIGPACLPGPCDDESACTVSDTCREGVCMGTPIDCDDHDACTQDACDPARGCVYTALPGCIPTLRADARRCHAALAAGGLRFADRAHRLLTRCLDRVLTDVAAGNPIAAATAACTDDLDRTNPTSRVSNAWRHAEAWIGTKCTGVAPSHVQTGCTGTATTMDEVIGCVLGRHAAGAARLVAGVYRSACSVLPVVGLGESFPAVCDGL